MSKIELQSTSFCVYYLNQAYLTLLIEMFVLKQMPPRDK